MMRGIALKIFLSFWLIFAVLIASFELLRDERRDFRFGDHLRQSGGVAALIFEGQGSAACAGYAAALEESAHIQFALLDAQRQAVCRSPGAPTADFTESIPIRSPGGASFTAVGRALPGFRLPFDRPPFPYRPVALAIVVSGIVCFAMARYLAAPLRHVRDVSYRLAAGDLHARAGPSVGRRHDEIGELVRDFDAMAARLEALVHAQSQLLSDISHELRSPLARLNVALELARRKAGPEACTDLNRIEAEAERMNELIGRVLALARAESNPQSLMTPVDLAAIVRQVAEDADYEAQRQDKLVDFCSTVTPTVEGDAQLIASAVDNVLRNAVRYTRTGSAVDVVLAATSDDAIVVVRDHGPGVPDAELERIFSPFHRVQSDRNRETGGVGLGLAIARRAITVHGGTITAANAPDRGLVVTIRLPLLERSEGPAEFSAPRSQQR